MGDPTREDLSDSINPRDHYIDLCPSQLVAVSGFYRLPALPVLLKVMVLWKVQQQNEAIQVLYRKVWDSSRYHPADRGKGIGDNLALGV
jgi:hypothetical protein